MPYKHFNFKLTLLNYSYGLFFVNVRLRRQFHGSRLMDMKMENKFELFVQQTMHSIFAQRIFSAKCGVLGTISVNFEKKTYFLEGIISIIKWIIFWSSTARHIIWNISNYFDSKYSLKIIFTRDSEILWFQFILLETPAQ